MNWIMLLQIIISLTQGALGGLTTAKAPQEILDALQSAIASLSKVHGSLVTKAQVDAYTLEFKW